MSKSIILGSNGYIGRNLVYFLKNKNEEIRCYDIQKKSFDNITDYQQLDITNYDSLCEIDFNVDFIYLFAGLTGTTNGFENYNKYIDINEKGLLNLLTRMRESHSEARIIFPSTRLVYKGQKGVLLKENSEKETKTIYAANKLTCEYILSIYKNAFNIKFSIFRICVPYGTMVYGDFSYGTIGFFLQKAMNGENISLYGDGLLKRTFTHVTDICSKIYTTIQLAETETEIYNIGGENLSLLDVALEIANKFGVKVEFSDWPEMALKIESGDTIFDSTKIDLLCQSGYSQTIMNWLNQQ